MANKSKKRVCIVVPAYNESTVIHNVIKDTQKIFKTSGYDFDILVVNDKSTDNTSSEAKRAGAIVVDHIINSGAGGATSTGITFAKSGSYDAVATMDGDGQHSPEDVLMGVNELFKTKKDLLIGSRLVDSQGMPRLKVIGNRGISFFTSVLFGINVTDTQSGLRIFSPKAFSQIHWRTTGYEFCSEMLWRAHQLGLSVGEYPIKAIYTDYSISKGQNSWNGINIVRSLLKHRFMELFE